MAIPDLTIKRGDSGKVISGQFKDADGNAVNCTGQTSRKIFMRKGESGYGALKINSTFSFTNESTGTWFYTTQSADVDTAGTYTLEFEVTLPGPRVETFPTDPDHPYIYVLIQRDLG